jgi:hypothetical protein
MNHPLDRQGIAATGLLGALMTVSAQAQTTTPDSVSTGIGAMKFQRGAACWRLVAR